MPCEVFRRLTDPDDVGSLSNRFRLKRFAIFRRLLASVPKPVTILDVGGTEKYWENMGFDKEAGVEIIVMNIHHIEVHHSNFQSIVGDARDMREFRDKELDVVFSNAVLQALGNFEDQYRMANEIRRVGKRYFVQAPSRYFPIEPHSLLPFFQFLPLSIQVWLITHSSIGWYKGVSDAQEAREMVSSIRLLTKKEMTALFPGGEIIEERLCFLVKSFIVYAGWGVGQNLNL
jgi:hypothetical protein